MYSSTQLTNSGFFMRCKGVKKVTENWENAFGPGGWAKWMKRGALSAVCSVRSLNYKGVFNPAFFLSHPLAGFAKFRNCLCLFCPFAAKMLFHCRLSKDRVLLGVWKVCAGYPERMVDWLIDWFIYVFVSWSLACMWVSGIPKYTNLFIITWNKKVSGEFRSRNFYSSTIGF